MAKDKIEFNGNLFKIFDLLFELALQSGENEI